MEEPTSSIVSQVIEWVKGHQVMVFICLYLLVRFFMNSRPMPETGGRVKSIKSEEEWKAAMAKCQEKGSLALVDFYATWCGPCRQIAPFIGELSMIYQDVDFFKIDVDKVRSVAAQNQVAAMPTFVLFKNGRRHDQCIGASREGIEALLKNNGAVNKKTEVATGSSSKKD